MRKLYKSFWGRLLLKALTLPGFSKLVGCFLDTRASVILIPAFIKKFHIDLSEVRKTDWASFNDFFKRRLIDGARPVDHDLLNLISPCDAHLRAYPIRRGRVITVKEIPYTIESLTGSRYLAQKYDKGLALVFRLTPSEYHRYIYPVSGTKSRDMKLWGELHTVRPCALENVPVFARNSRSYSVIGRSEFGPVVFMQVGALLVGRIVNEQPDEGVVTRGREAGYFEYGGSTVIMLLEAGRVRLREDIIKASAKGLETFVRLGTVIGRGV